MSSSVRTYSTKASAKRAAQRMMERVLAWGSPMRRCLARGNGDGRHDDNHSVHISTELMDVVRDLCRFAAASLFLHQAALAETLIEQCADLLVHRARVAGAAAGDRARPGLESSPENPNRDGGSEWTN